MALTDKQAAFVAEYLKDLNAAQAARAAGYSEKSAREQGYQQMQKPEIIDAIAVAMAERSERTRIDADWVLTRLAEEADADIADLYDEHNALKPVREWPLVFRKGLIAGIDVEELRVDGAAVGSVRKIKLSDRIKRIELIGRHVGVGAFVERRELTGKNGGPIEIEAKAGVSGLLRAAMQVTDDADEGAA